MSEPIDLAGMRDAARAVDVRCVLEFNKDSMRTRRFAAAWLFAAADEIDRLRQWKSEAITVLSGWDDVFGALGSPGKLGESKSAAAKAEIDRLRGELASWDRHVCTTTDDRWDLR